MPAFSQPLNIYNRALQHLGVSPLTQAQVDGSSNKAATECVRCYDALRESELRRNVWAFATREVMLRAISSTTLLWTPDAWSGSTSYSVGAVKSYLGDYYQAQPGVQIGDVPNTAATWLRYFGPITIDAFTTANQPYFAGEIITQSGTNYLSLISNNNDTPPTANWLAIGGTTSALNILYPLGAGPLNDFTTRNVFRRPYGYLRQAPNDPKKIDPFVGGPDYKGADDWLRQGEYITTMQAGPLYMRFIADVIDVMSMDPMFCEGVACRMADAMCEPLTQKLDKKRDIAIDYKTIMGDARTVNGIETGTIDPEEDEYLMVRL